MKKEYICYCGLYCENCAVKAKIEPAAQVLYKEMKKAGFEEIIHFIPGGSDFWPFLKEMSENGTCTSCQAGSGNPRCAVRICAKEKNIEMCALCESYPCALFDEFFKNYPILLHDNNLLLEKGIEEWSKIQDERRAQKITYHDLKNQD